MPLDLFFDKEGNPIDVHKWSELFRRTDEYRWIADDTVGPYRIATIWTGIDDDPPNRVIFETCVMKDGDWIDQINRDKTEADALARHAALVIEYKAKIPSDN